MALLLLLVCAVEIPLDQIWGFDTPGMSDVAGIPLPVVDESKRPGEDHESYRIQRAHIVEQIRQHLTTKPGSMKAMPGFVLAREPDFYTLRTAASRLEIVGKMAHPAFRPVDFNASPVPLDQELTLVIFSHPSAYFFRLKQVEREENTITVRYQFEPHFSPESTVHFALIPLGKLPLGEYKVEMEQLPMDKQWQEAGFLRVHNARENTLVSRPFSFTVKVKPPKPEWPGLRRIENKPALSFP